ncbi:MAG: outer membrane beta-barrel protein [Bacteroidales bacterium]
MSHNRSLLLFRSLYVFLVLIFIAGFASSQRFRGGLTGGLVASEISGDNLGGPNKLGWYASVYTSTSLSELSELKLAIMYIEKGSRSVPDENNNFFEYRLSLQYVEVPVTYRIDITSFTRNRYLSKLVLEGGLSASAIVGWREQEGGAEVPEMENREFYPFEGNILLGLTYPVGNIFDFHFGFSHGFTPARPHASGASRWYNRGQYNMLWTLGINYEIW